MLAGVSMDYYARLERGHLAGASESVLEAVARALQLDEAESQHLLDLAGNTETTMSRATRRPKPAPATPRPAVMAILAGMTGIPAYVRTRGWRSLPRTNCVRRCTGVRSMMSGCR
jgi:transcriptional regulator with XRE-family HTH domain